MKPGESHRERIDIWEEQRILSKVALRHKPGEDLILFTDRDLIHDMFTDLGSTIIDRLELDGYEFVFEDARVQKRRTLDDMISDQQVIQQDILTGLEQMKEAV